MEIAALHFTVVSGHAMLASGVYPTALALCDNRGPRASRSAPYLGGLGFAAAIGASRVLLGYHSPAEVISGLLPSGLVAMLMRARLAVALRDGRRRGAAGPRADRRLCAGRGRDVPRQDRPDVCLDRSRRRAHRAMGSGTGRQVRSGASGSGINYPPAGRPSQLFSPPRAQYCRAPFIPSGLVDLKARVLLIICTTVVL
ncbi:phosphatase PAP2 family protein [Burkholderia gladioli]|uniref:phosphatase PAP2 family protein n=1 Tax=Burkholderia gladioli TaxID=28095 RepID=UPI000F545C19|nr:phosphatase PAP2 family protein [Burkholderia gladioli]MBU9278469.1 phosphatase PAP2 family protein [Burkholderia gladioli]MDN7466320.1 phosphatase PAP2 family protein [Burkholderia gladioli]MDN7814483.1 phosphatase PAP2 family protein [Burkholderia gladioli]